MGVELYAIRPVIRMSSTDSKGAEEGCCLTSRTFQRDGGESWKYKAAFQGGEAVTDHFYRENGQYDMMCCEGGAHGHSGASGGGPVTLPHETMPSTVVLIDGPAQAYL